MATRSQPAYIGSVRIFLILLFTNAYLCIVIKKEQMKTKRDINDFQIGDGTWHEDYHVFAFPEYPSIKASVSESMSTESVYVTYTDESTLKSITMRFSGHANNAVRFGFQLSSDEPKEAVLSAIGYMKRVFVNDVVAKVPSRKLKSYEMADVEEADMTEEDIISLGVGADISHLVGKRIKGTNRVVKGDKVRGSVQVTGKYIYEKI